MRLPIKITFKKFLMGFLIYTVWALIYAVVLSLGDHILYVYAVFSALTSYYPLAFLSVLIIGFCKTFKLADYHIVFFLIVHFIIALIFSTLWLIID